MTVKELIEILQTCEQDAKVYVHTSHSESSGDEFGCSFDIDVVREVVSMGQSLNNKKKVLVISGDYHPCSPRKTELLQLLPCSTN